MAKEHDVVVIGGGHNGLVAAGYLAKAGLDVCVAEFYEKVGGGAMTLDDMPIPGYKSDIAAIFLGTILQNPLMKNDELKLVSKYGLKSVQTAGPLAATVFPDGRVLTVYHDINKTCESIAQFSPKDAEVFPKYCQTMSSLSAAVNLSYFSPPPSMGAFVSFLDASEEGREYLRMMMSSPLDIVNEWFESQQLRMQILALAHGSLSSPLEKGTGHYAAGLALMQMAGGGTVEGGQRIDIGLLGVHIPEGGIWQLCRALQDSIEDNGGTVLTSTEVKKVIVENGVAKGVVLANGEEIRATKAVVSNAHVKQLFLEMLESEVLPAGFREKVNRLRHGTARGTITLFLALNNSPKYNVGGDIDNAYYFYMYPLLDEYLDIHENYQKGIPTTRCLHLYIPTLVDPTRAPEGKHVMRILNLSPYELEDGSPAGWDKIKDEVGQKMLDNMRIHATNMGDDNILGRWVASPIDYERLDPAFYLGDTMHLSMNLSQLFGNRPLPGWHYKTPVGKLYMCGASTHPGGTLTGGSGRIVAQLVMEDLGIDFRKVISK